MNFKNSLTGNKSIAAIAAICFLAMTTLSFAGIEGRYVISETPESAATPSNAAESTVKAATPGNAAQKEQTLIPIEGWIYQDSAWYYWTDKGYATGWKEVLSEDGSSYWFYFGEDGRMYSDCETPDGYHVNEDGVYITGEYIISGYQDSDFSWNKDPDTAPGQLSGLLIAGHPAELYMLCLAGETSGITNIEAVKNGDNGCAYGICQMDYRYDLTEFMDFAYQKHPNLWPAFAKYLDCEDRSLDLRENSEIGNAFLEAMNVDYETAICDQMEYMTKQYWNDTANKLNAAGFGLDERSIAVSAAMFSVNVNCGAQTAAYIENLSPSMTDEEMIRQIYQLRNTTLAGQKAGKILKGTTPRYRQAEPQMALDLLYGYVTIDSDVTYGNGVEWHGNPFVSQVTTVPKAFSISNEMADVATGSNSTTESVSDEMPTAGETITD